jgi:hypothetical protein
LLANAHGGVLVVPQAYHGLNESAPFNMIGAAVKSPFYLIVMRHSSGTRALIPMLFMWQCNIRLIFHPLGAIGMSLFAKSHIRL